jgi:hypothetical protein
MFLPEDKGNKYKELSEMTVENVTQLMKVLETQLYHLSSKVKPYI